MAFKRITFFGLPLDVNGTTADIAQRLRENTPACFVTFVGPDAWQLAKSQPEYRAHLEKMSLVIADGHGVAQACRFFTHENCQSISFDMTSFARDFFTIASEEKIPLIVVGGQPRDDEDAEDKLRKYFPDINIVDTMHGYSDFAPKIAAIMAKAPKAVVVAINSPRQEAFLDALREAGYKGFAIGCGDFIKHYISDADYQEYPAWVDRYKLMPLYRIVKEPRRLWQRYVAQYHYFAFLVMKGLIGTLTEKRETVATQTGKD